MVFHTLNAQSHKADSLKLQMSFQDSIVIKRLEVIVPYSNSTVEKEFSETIQGSEMTIHYSKAHLKRVIEKGFQEMKNGLNEAAELLSDAAVDAVLFAFMNLQIFPVLDQPEELGKAEVSSTLTSLCFAQ